MKKAKLSLLAIALVFTLFASQVYSQWTFVGFVTGAGTFPSVSVYGPTNVAVFGGPNGTGKVFRSTTSGASWTDISGTGLGLELYCGWAVDGNIMFAGDGGVSGGQGGNAKVYKTTNGGTTWAMILSTGGSAGFINAVVFSRTTPTFGVIQSDPPTGAGQQYWLQKTTDGGTTWTQIIPVPGIAGAASSQNGLVVIDANFFNFGLNAGTSRLDGTTNGGTSWSVMTLSGITGAFISGNAWNNDKLNGCACSSTSLPNISRTVNGGTSWTATPTGVTGAQTYCNLKWIHGSNTVYLMGTSGTNLARKSTDNGATWTGLTLSAPLTGFTHMDYYRTNDSVYLYAIAGDGSVMRLVQGIGPLGIDPNNTSTPTSFALQQNYPNPFNPETNIKYSVPEGSNVSIRIYNTLGVEIKTVVDRYHTTGNYVEQVNMDNFASGVYFYTMKSDNFSETKRMMLVK